MRKLFYLFLLFPIFGFGQDEDFQIWSSADVHYKWNKKISFDLEQALRTGHNSLLLNKTYSEFKMNYKLQKKLKISSGYRFIQSYIGENMLGHRFFTDVKYRYKLDRIKLNYRLRYQYQSNTERINQAIRNQLKISYNLPKTSIEPYFSGEGFYTLYQGFDKCRFTIGLKEKFGKRFEVNLFYRYQREVNSSNVQKLNILGASISYDLGKRKKRKKKSPKDK